MRKYILQKISPYHLQRTSSLYLNLSGKIFIYHTLDALTILMMNMAGSINKEKFLLFLEELKKARHAEVDEAKQVNINGYTSINWKQKGGILKLTQNMKSCTRTFLKDSNFLC